METKETEENNKIRCTELWKSKLKINKQKT